MKKNIGIIIEARMGSSRLPGKTLKPMLGKPMLQLMIERLKRVNLADQIIVATTTNEKDLPIVELAKKMDVKYYQGSEDDVLERVLCAARKFEVDIIVETCGDSPLIDPKLLDYQIDIYLKNNFDYVCCHLEKTFPIGLDAKIFSTNTLDEVSKLTNEPADRENVNLYIWEHPNRYKLKNITAKNKYKRPDLRLVVDYPEDFVLVEKIYNELYHDNPEFDFDDILDLFNSYPELIKINKDVINIEVAGRKNKE